MNNGGHRCQYASPPCYETTAVSLGRPSSWTRFRINRHLKVSWHLAHHVVNVRVSQSQFKVAAVVGFIRQRSINLRGQHSKDFLVEDERRGQLVQHWGCQEWLAVTLSAYAKSSVRRRFFNAIGTLFDPKEPYCELSYTKQACRQTRESLITF